MQGTTLPPNSTIHAPEIGGRHTPAKPDYSGTDCETTDTCCPPGYYLAGDVCEPDDNGGDGNGGTSGSGGSGGGTTVGRLGSKAEPGGNCEGSQKDIGGWVGGTGDNGGNEINNIYEIQANTSNSSSVVGWIYATFSNGNWFQPAVTVSVSGGAAVAQAGVSASTPSISIGNTTPAAIQSAMQTFDSAEKLAASAVPAPFSTLLSGGVTASKCWTNSWNGQYPS